MQQPVFYTVGRTDALAHAGKILQQWGHLVSPVPSTHVTHLLLPVPSFEKEDIVKGGHSLSAALKHLPENITVMGGHLPPLPYRCIDFLTDEPYLSENAELTAGCTLELLQQRRDLTGAAVLVIGWGRIGKALLPLLKKNNARVTAAVRKEADLLRLTSLGERSTRIGQWEPDRYDIIINTAPAPVLDGRDVRPGTLLVDLASVPGISDPSVVWTRGLPNQMAPEASGALIAKTALRYALGKE